ncbi:MAG: hypothetical protein M0O94_00020 [Bacteroidales bacterium]|nr:hypothetical protein [Bacteroidales bacterium]MDD2323987.1 hypothetical protein [Bacteroidales bacterium]MDY0284556.1 hypothetical protein [Bacteroidales bacterium]HPE85818.1 hypothetical protein [Bacteroidales bacterium]
MFKTLIIPAILLFSIFTTSCSTERMLASDFMDLEAPVAILVLPPGQLLKQNNKTFEIEGYDTLTPEQQVIQLREHSALLKYISDSRVVDGFYNTFVQHLAETNLQVFTPTYKEEFFAVTNKPAYILSIAQLQLEEYYEPLNESGLCDNPNLVPDAIYLNAMALNAWIDIKNVKDTLNSLLLFGTDVITDAFSSSYRTYPFTGEVKFKMNRDLLEPNDVYAFSDVLGFRFSSFIYDYFMNHYIHIKMPEGQRPDAYYHYDPLNRAFLPANEKMRFEVIE